MTNSTNTPTTNNAAMALNDRNDRIVIGDDATTPRGKPETPRVPHGREEPQPEDSPAVNSLGVEASECGLASPQASATMVGMVSSTLHQDKKNGLDHYDDSTQKTGASISPCVSEDESHDSLARPPSTLIVPAQDNNSSKYGSLAIPTSTTSTNSAGIGGDAEEQPLLLRPPVTTAQEPTFLRYLGTVLKKNCKALLTVLVCAGMALYLVITEHWEIIVVVGVSAVYAVLEYENLDSLDGMMKVVPLIMTAKATRVASKTKLFEKSVEALKELMEKSIEALKGLMGKLDDRVALVERGVDEWTKALEGQINQLLEDLREEFGGSIDQLREDLRGELQESIGQLREDLREEFRVANEQLRDEFRSANEQLRDEFRSANEQLRDEFRSANEQLRDEFRSANEQLRDEFRSANEQLRDEFRAEIRSANEQLRDELRAEIRSANEQLCNDLRAEIRSANEQIHDNRIRQLWTLYRDAKARGDAAGAEGILSAIELFTNQPAI